MRKHRFLLVLIVVIWPFKVKIIIKRVTAKRECPLWSKLECPLVG